MKIAGMETGQVTRGRALTVVCLSITLVWVLGTSDEVEEVAAAPDAVPAVAVAAGTSAPTGSRGRESETSAPPDDWRQSFDRSRRERLPLNSSTLETMLGRDPFVRAPDPVVLQFPDPIVAESQEPADDDSTAPAPELPIADPPEPVVLAPASLRPEFIAVAADGAASFVLNGNVYRVGDVLADGSVVKSITVAGVTTTRSKR